MKTYDLKSVIAILAGIDLSGYGEDGGLEFEPASDIGEPTVGADGKATFSRSNNTNWTLKLTLMQTSMAYTLVAEAMKAQAALPAIVPTPFSMIDPNTGDSITCAYPTFTKQPSMAKNRKVGQATFEIYLPKPIVTFGALNTP